MADETIPVLADAWRGQGASRDELDEECGPTKVCRNMREVNFEAANFQSGSDTGADLGTAWRAKLAREGKITAGSTSLGDLITSLVDPKS